MKELTRKSAILYLVLVFIAGGIAGGAGGYYYAKKSGFRPPGRPPGKFEDFIIARLTEDLKLTSNQVSQIFPIIQTNIVRFDSIRAEMDERTTKVFEEMNSQMGQHLSDEQKTKLAELEQRRRDFHKHPGRKGGKPRP